MPDGATETENVRLKRRARKRLEDHVKVKGRLTIDGGEAGEATVRAKLKRKPR